MEKSFERKVKSKFHENFIYIERYQAYEEKQVLKGKRHSTLNTLMKPMKKNKLKWTIEFARNTKRMF